LTIFLTVLPTVEINVNAIDDIDKNAVYIQKYFGYKKLQSE